MRQSESVLSIYTRDRAKTSLFFAEQRRIRIWKVGMCASETDACAPSCDRQRQTYAASCALERDGDRPGPVFRAFANVERQCRNVRVWARTVRGREMESECRLCSEGKGVASIDDALRYKINDCCGIAIKEADGLPQKVCVQCKVVICSFFVTRLSYQKRQKELQIKIQNDVPKIKQASNTDSEPAAKKAHKETPVVNNNNIKSAVKIPDLNQNSEPPAKKARLETPIVIKHNTKSSEKTPETNSNDTLSQVSITFQNAINSEKVLKVNIDEKSLVDDKSDSNGSMENRVPVMLIRYNCTICSKSFPNMEYLKSHKIDSHNKIIKLANSLTKPCYVRLEKLQFKLPCKLPFTLSPKWVYISDMKIWKLDSEISHCVVSRSYYFRDPTRKKYELTNIQATSSIADVPQKEIIEVDDDLLPIKSGNEDCSSNVTISSHTIPSIQKDNLICNETVDPSFLSLNSEEIYDIVNKCYREYSYSIFNFKLKFINRIKAGSIDVMWKHNDSLATLPCFLKNSKAKKYLEKANGLCSNMIGLKPYKSKILYDHLTGLPASKKKIDSQLSSLNGLNESPVSVNGSVENKPSKNPSPSPLSVLRLSSNPPNLLLRQSNDQNQFPNTSKITDNGQIINKEVNKKEFQIEISNVRSNAVEVMPKILNAFSIPTNSKETTNTLPKPLNPPEVKSFIKCKPTSLLMPQPLHQPHITVVPMEINSSNNTTGIPQIYQVTEKDAEVTMNAANPKPNVLSKNWTKKVDYENLIPSVHFKKFSNEENKHNSHIPTKNQNCTPILLNNTLANSALPLSNVLVPSCSTNLSSSDVQNFYITNITSSEKPNLSNIDKPVTPKNVEKQIKQNFIKNSSPSSTDIPFDRLRNELKTHGVNLVCGACCDDTPPKNILVKFKIVISETYKDSANLVNKPYHVKLLYLSNGGFSIKAINENKVEEDICKWSYKYQSQLIKAFQKQAILETIRSVASMNKDIFENVEKLIGILARIVLK